MIHNFYFFSSSNQKIENRCRVSLMSTAAKQLVLHVERYKQEPPVTAITL